MKIINELFYKENYYKSIRLFRRSVIAHEFRKPLKMNLFQHSFDTFCNKMDGFKPIPLEKTDKATGKKTFLRDNKGRKLVNWVRKTVSDGKELTTILPWNGGKVFIAKDLKTGNILEKEFKTPYSITLSEFKDGKPAFIAKKSLEVDNQKKIIENKFRFWDIISGKKAEDKKVNRTRTKTGFDDAMIKAINNFAEKHDCHYISDLRGSSILF